MEDKIMSYNGLLHTPCGDLVVVDEDEAHIPFYLRKNIYDCPYEFETASGKIKAVHTDTNYSLVIDAASLKYGKNYRIYLCGTELDYGDSDERTECVSGCSNGYYIAIGAYSPNDDEKMEQAYFFSEKEGILKHHIIQEPPKYDESKFIMYDVEMLDDKSGFSFHLIDDKCSEIVFLVAWIKSVANEEDDYEGAVQFWTT